MPAYVDPQFITIKIYTADTCLIYRNTEVYYYGMNTDELLVKTHTG
jgi:hypothetical protein